MDPCSGYRGRIAPSPTGYLHVGHAMTFWRAQERAAAAGGQLVLRIEDVDLARCRPEFRDAMEEDLRWFGIRWDDGPYFQSERFAIYRDALAQLRRTGAVYPCRCSRKDVIESSLAPHEHGITLAQASSSDIATASQSVLDEPIYPGTCRNIAVAEGEKVSWRFRVPDGEELRYVDLRLGEQRAIAGQDFGDFVLWRRDDVPAYQIAVVVDDAAMDITEVVRGEDLRLSTFRQLLLYRALRLSPPKFYHGPLVTDRSGNRLAKRDAALSLRALRGRGVTPEQIRAENR